MATGLGSIYKGSEELTLECDICKHQGLASEATAYCMMCTEALCPACHKVHRAGKLTRGHKLLTGDQLLDILTGSQRVPAFMVCDKHQLPVKYFCKDDDKVFCKTCKLTSHKSCHTTDLVTQAVKTKPSKIFGKIKHQLTQLEQKHEQFIKRKSSDKGILNAQIQTCLDELTRTRRTINGILDALEMKMKAEIRDAETKTAKELDDQLLIADDTLKRIRETMELMKESEKTHKDEVMFVAMKKAELVLPNYENDILNLEDTTIDIGYILEPNGKLQTNLEHIRPFGELIQLPSVLNITLDKGTFYHYKCANVASIIFLPGGQTVLACGKDGLKLLDRKFQVISELLSIRAARGCNVSDTEILVTHGTKANATFFNVLPTMVPGKGLNIGRLCTGVDYYKNEAYICCHDGPGNGEVRVVDRNSRVQRSLGFDGQHYMFTWPCDVKVTNNGDKVIVADTGEHCVICLDQQGRVVYRYTDTDLRTPNGILLDAYDNVLVCGTGSNNIHAVSKDGDKRNTLLSEKDGLKYPLCISYRHRDGCFAVGFHQNNDKSICIFHAKKK